MSQRRDGFWRVPRIWPGRTVFILGGGPSLKTVDVRRLRGQRVLAVNNAYKLGAWIDAVYCMDGKWLPREKDGLAQFPGLKVSVCDQHSSDLGRMLGVRVVRGRNAPGLCREPDTIARNLSAGAGAINLAVHLGAKRIVLLGYDMRSIDGKRNWHDDYPPNPKVPDPYGSFLTRFPGIAEDLKRLNIECINATPGSALKCFPIVDPEEALP